MGFFDRWHDNQVNSAIDVLNSGQAGTLARGAVSTLIKHPDANPFAMPSLVNVARMHPDPALRELAKWGLQRISISHKDPVVRERASKAVNRLSD